MDVLSTLGVDQAVLLTSAAQLVTSFLPGSTSSHATNDMPQASFSALITLALRAVIVGMMFTWMRKLYNYVLEHGGKMLFPTAFIQTGDEAEKWIIAWIASDTRAQSQLHHFQLSTKEVDKVRAGSANQLRRRRRKDVYSPGPEEFNDDEASWKSGKIVGRMLPDRDQVIRLSFQGSFIWLKRIKPKTYSAYYEDAFSVSTWAFQRQLLIDFLAEAHERYHAKEENELLIFHSESREAEWKSPISRPVRPWSSVILPLKESILKDMRDFLSPAEAKWYAARGIPHRRGYLFHGDPGAGKTTLITALASRLKLSIYVINISQSGMDDNRLAELFRSCRSGSIILIEDIDRVFDGDKGTIETAKDGSSVKVNTEDGTVLQPPAEAEQLADHVADNSTPPEKRRAEVVVNQKQQKSIVTMSGLLNAIDGVSSQEGCLLIASTNHPDKLDPALCRAGRFDVKVPFGPATPDQARALFLHFFPPPPPLTLPVDKSHSTDSLPDVNEKVKVEVKVKVNGHLPEKEKSDLVEADLTDLATSFADALFPLGEEGGMGGQVRSRVAMATLQAYLLNYKTDPREAVPKVGVWAEDAARESLAAKNAGKTGLKG